MHLDERIKREVEIFTRVQKALLEEVDSAGVVKTKDVGLVAAVLTVGLIVQKALDAVEAVIQTAAEQS